jgi:plasmid stability protein
LEHTLKNLTVRNLPQDVADALEQEKQRRGASLNQTVIDLLKQGLGVPGTRSNGLARLAGRWSEEEHEEFRRAVAPFEDVDADLWK